MATTFVVYRPWSDETLYQIWARSHNPRQSYCDFSIWPNDLEHVWRVTCSARLWAIFSKFELGQLLRAWVSVFSLLIKLCTKFEQDPSIRGWVTDNLANIFLRAGGPNCTKFRAKFGGNRVRSIIAAPNRPLYRNSLSTTESCRCWRRDLQLGEAKPERRRHWRGKEVRRVFPSQADYGVWGASLTLSAYQHCTAFTLSLIHIWRCRRRG